MKKQSISIVIPIYNESETIKSVLVELKNFLDKQSDIEYEIICVNDCSTDNSLEILNSIDFIRVISHKINRGYGAALKTGINNAKNETVLIMDSDGQHKPEDIPRILKPLKEGYNMVVGSRKITNTKKSRILGKILLHKVASYLIRYKIPDINSGFRCFYKSEAKQYLHLCSDRFSFTTSITLAYLQDGKDVKYVPIEVRERAGGESQVKLKSGLRTLLKIIQIVMVFNPLRVLLPLVFLFMFLTGVSLIHDILKENLTDTTTLLATTTLLLFVFALISDQLSAIRQELCKK